MVYNIALNKSLRQKKKEISCKHYLTIKRLIVPFEFANAITSITIRYYFTKREDQMRAKSSLIVS